MPLIYDCCISVLRWESRVLSIGSLVVMSKITLSKTSVGILVCGDGSRGETGRRRRDIEHILGVRGQIPHELMHTLFSYFSLYI